MRRAPPEGAPDYRLRPSRAAPTAAPPPPPSGRGDQTPEEAEPPADRQDERPIGKGGQARLGRCVAVGCRGNGRRRRRPVTGPGRHYGLSPRPERARAGEWGAGEPPARTAAPGLPPALPVRRRPAAGARGWALTGCGTSRWRRREAPGSRWRWGRRREGRAAGPGRAAPGPARPPPCPGLQLRGAGLKGAQSPGARRCWDVYGLGLRAPPTLMWI